MLWVLIIIVAFVLDRITKIAVVNNIPFGESIPVIDKFFYLTYWENKGAAWGILQNGRYFFIIVTLIIGLVMGYMLYKADNRLLKLSLSLVLGGAVGNFVDRVYKGSVTDFLQFYFGSYQYPIFNIADSFVVVGTIILAFYLLVVQKDNNETKPEENPPAAENIVADARDVSTAAEEDKE